MGFAQDVGHSIQARNQLGHHRLTPVQKSEETRLEFSLAINWHRRYVLHVLVEAAATSASTSTSTSRLRCISQIQSVID